MKRIVRHVVLAVALLALAAGTAAAQGPPRGRVAADTVRAPSLAGNLLGDPERQPAFVYLPPGYDEEPARRYAVIYLLHGILDSPRVWVEPVYQGMTIQAVMDSLIAAGRIRPMIVVMPNGANAYGGSMYMNSTVGGRWGDFVAQDLVEHVDATYRTIPAAQSRAIAGHSMGGFGAIRLSMLHPDVFSVAWGMNPCCLCCLTDEPIGPSVGRALETARSASDLWRRLEEERDIWPIAVAASAAAFAPDPERPPLYIAPLFRLEGDSLLPVGPAGGWDAALPLAHAAEHVGELRSLRGLAFDTAFDDEFAHIPAGTKLFSDTLEALGVPHLYEVYEGDHRNRMSERLPGRVLPWIDARLVHEAALRFEIDPADSALAPSILEYAREGAARVEATFGQPFARPVTVRVFPDRASFDRHLRESWGMSDVGCWMVGGAEEEALVLLSPRVWGEEACDHDPGNAAHVRDLVAHELVHVYHMQANPTNDFDGVEGLDWFIEGLATFVSGQLERSHAARAREAVEKGASPDALDDAWTGPYRYGVAGSLVAFVAERLGPAGVASLLLATTREEVLRALGVTEPELLAGWRAWVLRATGTP